MLTAAAVAELAGLLHDWETDAAEVVSQADGRYGARPLQTDAEAITFLSDDPSPPRGEGRVRGEDAAGSTLPQPLPEREGGSGTDSAPQPSPSSCGHYEITYAGQSCGWPAACAIVPRALKCVVLKVIENTAVDEGCVRMEFLDR